MKSRSVLGMAATALTIALFLGFLWEPPASRSQPPAPAAPQTVDEKLNQILNRLDKIERRLDE
jgi:hypothetical protein